MTNIKEKLEALRKALDYKGIKFHSPNSVSVMGHLGGQKAPEYEGNAVTPNHEAHLVYNSATPHQKSMVSAMDNQGMSPEKGIPLHKQLGSGNVGNYTGEGNAFIHHLPAGSFLMKKNFPLEPEERKAFGIDDRKMSLAQREVGYHNMAHQFFGLGEHVPETALYSRKLPQEGEAHWSMHQWLPEHHIGVDADKTLVEPKKNQKTPLSKQIPAIMQAHKQGYLPRMNVMDAVLGNLDRHAGNIMFGKDGDMKFIDHGLSFSSKNKAPVSPWYHDPQYGLTNERMPEGFRDWVLGLRPEKFSQLMDNHNVPREAKEMALRRLEQAHEAANKHDYFGDFFSHLRKPVF